MHTALSLTRRTESPPPTTLYPHHQRHRRPAHAHYFACRCTKTRAKRKMQVLRGQRQQATTTHPITAPTTPFSSKEQTTAPPKRTRICPPAPLSLLRLHRAARVALHASKSTKMPRYNSRRSCAVFHIATSRRPGQGGCVCHHRTRCCV